MRSISLCFNVVASESELLTSTGACLDLLRAMFALVLLGMSPVTSTVKSRLYQPSSDSHSQLNST